MSAGTVSRFDSARLAAWQARLVAAYIDTNIDSAIRADDLAVVAGVSTSHLFRAFRATFGETPAAYIVLRRMRRAQELMLSSNEPLSQVALACGLSDQSHFTSVFRRVVGMTPHTWRLQFVDTPVTTSDRSRARLTTSARMT